jgi:hypothetical protein
MSCDGCPYERDGKCTADWGEGVAPPGAHCFPRGERAETTGAGTTGLVAARLQRNAVLVELNPDYAKMAEERLRRELGGMFTEICLDDH